MMFFSFVARVKTKNGNAGEDAQRSDTPTTFDLTHCSIFKDISQIPSYNVKLESGVRYCFSVYKSIFVNGDPVNMVGFVDTKEKISGKGVFAVCEENDGKKINTIMIESDNTQTVTLFGNIDIPIGEVVYITTKQNTGKFDLLQKSKMGADKNLRSNLILLGPKTNINITIQTDFYAFGRVYAPGDLNSPKSCRETKIQSDKIEFLNYTEAEFAQISAVSSDKRKEFYIDIKSEGDTWKSEMDGYITTSPWHIYSRKEFHDVYFGLSSNVIFSLAVGGVFAAAILGFLCYLCCCRKDESRKSRRSSRETYDGNDQKDPMPLETIKPKVEENVQKDQNTVEDVIYNQPEPSIYAQVNNY